MKIYGYVSNLIQIPFLLNRKYYLWKTAQWSPKDVHILILGENKLPYLEEADFADVIKGLEIGRLAWII